MRRLRRASSRSSKPASLPFWPSPGATGVPVLFLSGPCTTASSVSISACFDVRSRNDKAETTLLAYRAASRVGHRPRQYRRQTNRQQTIAASIPSAHAESSRAVLGRKVRAGKHGHARGTRCMFSGGRVNRRDHRSPLYSYGSPIARYQSDFQYLWSSAYTSTSASSGWSAGRMP